MSVLFIDFQQCTWLRPTSWKICEYQSHPWVHWKNSNIATIKDNWQASSWPTGRHSCFPGKFTATIAGVYTFTLSARAGRDGDFHADIFMEKLSGEEVQICGSGYTTGSHTPGSCSVVYELGEIHSPLPSFLCPHHWQWTKNKLFVKWYELRMEGWGSGRGGGLSRCLRKQGERGPGSCTVGKGGQEPEPCTGVGGVYIYSYWCPWISPVISVVRNELVIFSNSMNHWNFRCWR